MEHYHRLLANAADFMIGRLDAEVVFFPLEQRMFDVQHSHAVVGRMSHAQRATVLKRAYTPGQILSLLQHFEFAVGMRLHFLILAALAGVPFVPLPYATKVSGFIEALDLAFRELEHVSAGSLLAKIDRAWDEREQLRARTESVLPELKARARMKSGAAPRPAGAIRPDPPCGRWGADGRTRGSISMRERQTDIVIVGGGLGGTAAAVAALRLGCRVIMTEETDWIGGQLTSQAVPPDEHPWIEGTGCTATYRRLRHGIREYYRRNYPLLPQARFNALLNPGEGRVSPLCHEPRVALAVLHEMLAPHLASRQLELFLRCRPVAVERHGDRVRAVTFADEEAADRITVEAPYVLDSTELGDVLPLAVAERAVGAESQADTGEPHALSGGPDPLDQQAITACFALDCLPDQDHTVERPADYDFWREYRADFWPGPQLGWTFTDPVTLDRRSEAIFRPRGSRENELWTFRRIFYRGHYPEGAYASDVTLVNWPQNDYWLGPIAGVPDDERERHMRAAQQLSLSLLYWMQTEAPRHDRGYGYPELRLRHDIVGTRHGLAKHVYVRESRRIRAEFTVLEQHVGVAARGNVEGAQPFADTVGVGSYRIDLHPSTRRRTYVDISSWPFQIPLGALIPVRMEDLLPPPRTLA